MVGGLGPPCWGAPPCSWYGPARDVGDMGIVVGVESDSSDRLSAGPRGAFWGGLGGGGGSSAAGAGSWAAAAVDGGPSPPSSPGILPSASCMGDQRVVLQVRTKKVGRRQGE